jgi:CHAD domain-containing protein
MAVVLDPTQPIPDAVRQAAEKQLRKAVEAVTGQAGLTPDEAAHDARKRCKKLRGLIRLVRQELGDEIYRRENGALRDAARRLSEVRDAWVLVEALDDLVTPADDALASESVSALRATLAREHRRLQSERADGGVEADAAALEAVLARVPRWPLDDRGWASLDEGLHDTVRRGRHRMEAALTTGRAEDLHEWRKQVKYLRYQLGLVRAAWPEVLKAMEDTADELGDLLGSDHDLAVLRGRILTEPDTATAVRDALLDRIDGRRKKLQEQAVPLGRRLYLEKPARLTRRLGNLWQVAA